SGRACGIDLEKDAVAIRRQDVPENVCRQPALQLRQRTDNFLDAQRVIPAALTGGYELDEWFAIVVEGARQKDGPWTGGVSFLPASTSQVGKDVGNANGSEEGLGREEVHGWPPLRIRCTIAVRVSGVK